MTISSNFKPPNIEEFRKILLILDKILDVLGEFKNNYECRLNFSRLVDLLKLPKSEIDEIINLILKFQEKFNDVFFNYRLQKIRTNGYFYIVAKKIDINNNEIPLNITFSRTQLEQLNDIFYTFKHVKRGKGFDINKNGTRMSANLKNLKEEFPYLFETKDNKLIYPSDFGVKLGDLIISYNKSNREIDSSIIGKSKISVVKHG
ncbi:MAG: hypothetical protein ACFFEY_03710 [Candidatus Thorarchaeota archaeon]